MDFKGAKNYKPGAYETFSDNLGDMLIDLLNGDEKLLNSPEIQALGASNVKAALEWLATADINGDYKDLIANEGWRLMYKRKPPRPEEFLTWDWIGAQSEGLWPNVRHAFEEFCNPDPLNPKRGLALSTSIGWGKANPVDSNIVVDKTIHLDLEDGTRLNIPSNEIVEILVNGKLTKVSANNLLSMDLESIDLPQAVKIKSISYSYTHKKMGELRVGDEIVGPAGEKFKIREITDHGEQDVYKIILSDGRSFESMLSHLSTVHFRNSHTRPGKKVYDTVTTGYIMDHLEKYLFEIPTDETFKWSELDAPQFLEMLPLHEYEPIDDKYLIPDLTKDPNKVYITKIEKTRREICKCIAVDYPWGLYLIEDGILTHNSLLTNLCMSYIITHFCLMREPYKVLGHSQPVYEKVKLPSGKYTTIGDLKIGQEIAGVLKDTSKIIDIYDQGEKETYELTFDDNTTCKCSLDHYWTVYDFSNQNYIVLKTKDIINNTDRYGFPDLEDCKRDREAILVAEQYFENTNYQRIDLDIDQVILEVSMLQKILFSEDIKGVYNRESFYKKYQKEIDTIYENSKGRISKRRHSYFYDNQYFDSSDELTFYVYRKFYDTPVKRNVANNINSFYVEYEANGKKHKAFPDFVDEQSNYYEIKGKHLLDENGNFINPFTTDPSVLETFKQKGEALKKAKVIILDSNKIKCMQRVLLQEKQIDTTSRSPYRKDLTKKEYIQFLWDIYKKDHKMDYNPNRACFKPIFNTFKQDLPIKFEDIPSIEKTCDRIWGRQRVSCICKNCGTFFEKTYITLKNHEMLELCKSCLQKHVAQNRSQEIKDLRSKRLSEKLKAVRQTKNEEIVAKRNATIVERYGSKENLVKIVTEKARATNYEKYGIASLTAAMNLKNKEKQNCEKTC